CARDEGYKLNYPIDYW
nr:immunoglobulin heavy chain junction region [Macaca mulatta]MOW85098.1 immunoglobulin heavy chain junction region [Macaca mulatta]